MEKLTFEQRLERVRAITESIERGEQPLEESVRQFEAGMQALNELEKELGEMKRRISILKEGPDGTLREEPLEVDA